MPYNPGDPNASLESVRIIEEEEGKETGGHFAAVSPAFDAAANAITDKDFTLSIPVSVLAMEITTKHCNPGDRVRLEVAPETAVGVTTAAVGTGLKVIPIPDSVVALLQNETLWIGQELSLKSGGTKENLGAIKEWDADAKTITVKKATVASFPNASQILITKVMTTSPFEECDGWIELDDSDVVLSIGTSKIGASYISAGKVIRFKYDNTSGSIVRVRPTIEFLY